MRVWVTRTQSGADATAARLKELGHEPLVAPLLAVWPLEAKADLMRVSALAFTSANAVRAFDRAGRDPDMPVFAVGEATAQAALIAGYTDVHAGPSDVAALGVLIGAVLPDGAVVLHPCAAERAGDLEAPLAAAGLILRAVPVYETVPAPSDAAILAAMGSAEAILLHSPKAARALKALLERHSTPAARLLCLSPAVAAALQGGKIPAVALATLPNDTALLNLL